MRTSFAGSLVGTCLAITVLALTRYRAMIPFMFVLILLEHLAVKPIATAGTHPGSYINLVLVALMIVGLARSLLRRPDLPLRQ